MAFISFYIMQIVNCSVLCLKEKRNMFLNVSLQFTFSQRFQKIPFIKYFITEKFKLTQQFQHTLLKAKGLIFKNPNHKITITPQKLNNSLVSWTSCQCETLSQLPHNFGNNHKSNEKTLQSTGTSATALREAWKLRWEASGKGLSICCIWWVIPTVSSA